MASCLPRPSAVCLRGQLSSNVRPHHYAHACIGPLGLAQTLGLCSLTHSGSQPQRGLCASLSLCRSLLPSKRRRLQSTSPGVALANRVSCPTVVFGGPSQACCFHASTGAYWQRTDDRGHGQAGCSMHIVYSCLAWRSLQSHSYGPLRVRPNPSLKLTRYGTQRKPGPQPLGHHRVPGLRCAPPRAA